MSKIIGKIVCVTNRGFFFVEVRNPATGELVRYFGLDKNVIRQIPEEVERGCPARFTPEPNFKATRPNQLPLALEVEIFPRGTFPVANPETAEVRQ